jgi:hypothetical protein
MKNEAPPDKHQPVQLAYRPKHASKIIDCGLTHLYELIADGKIEARKDGRNTLVIASSLAAYLDSLPPADLRTGQAELAASKEVTGELPLTNVSRRSGRHDAEQTSSHQRKRPHARLQAHRLSRIEAQNEKS